MTDHVEDGEKLPTLTYDIESSSGELPADIRVHRFRMIEAISEPYTVSLDVVTMDVDFAFEALLGHDIQLSLLRETTIRPVFGIVTAIDWLGISGDHLMLRLTLRPALAMLEQQVQTRMFQELSVAEILSEVLGEELDAYGRRYDDSAIIRGQNKRPYCTQYAESNLAFVSRLLEEEGISYVFVHDEGEAVEKLLLIDTVSSMPEAANIDDNMLFPIVVTNPDETSLESVQAIEWRRRVTSTGVLRRDYDWLQPEELLDSDAETRDSHGRSRRVYLHGGRRFVSDDLATRAADQQAALARIGTRGLGRSNAAGFHAGQRVDVDGHVLETLDTELLLYRVEHEGHDPSALPSLISQSNTIGGYFNTFEVMHASAELRPAALTPRPRVHGPQTALVTGPSGEEIHVDEFGRVSVQFYWDENPPYDDSSSCWIRVAQRWAGPSWGMQFIPRVGMEVVVDFLEGNPDRPLITGCVYNGTNAPPYALPDNKTQSGIKSNSSPGGNGSNELRFEDAAGSEEVYLHAQKDWAIAVENDKGQTVGNDESLEVGNDRRKHIKHDELITVDNDEKVTIKHDMSLTVANNQTVKVGMNHSESIGGDRSETIANSASQTVGTTNTLTVGAAMQVSVGAALNASVGAAAGIEVGGAIAMIVGGAASETVGENKSIQVGKELVIRADEATQISTGKGLSLSAKEGITVSADKDFSASAKAKALIEAADQLTIKCGSAQIVLKSSGDIAITGGKIDVKGTSAVNVKGPKINNN